MAPIRPGVSAKNILNGSFERVGFPA